MNERIKLLAKQAGLKIEYQMINPPKPLQILGSAEQFEKFAELIVKECLDISYKESHLPNAILFDERSDKFIKNIHNRIDRATKKHFGVEE